MLLEIFAEPKIRASAVVLIITALPEGEIFAVLLLLDAMALSKRKMLVKPAVWNNSLSLGFNLSYSFFIAGEYWYTLFTWPLAFSNA